MRIRTSKKHVKSLGGTMIGDGIMDKDIYIYIYWLVVSPLWKYEFISWDDEIPNWMEK